MESLPLPIGWLETPRRGYAVEDLFIPMKTILDDRYKSLVTSATIFDMEFIRDLADVDGIVLLIDLIDSENYYKSEDMQDLLQIKITISENICFPTSNQIQAFIKIVNKNIELDPGGKIGVHCTNGYNITGFMIVNYLVIQRGLTLNEALGIFSKARPPGIYDVKYLQQLVKLFQPSTPIIYPDPPKWMQEIIEKQKIPEPPPFAELPAEFKKPDEVCKIRKPKHDLSASRRKRKSSLLADSIETGSLKKKHTKEKTPSPTKESFLSQHEERIKKKVNMFEFLIPMCPKTDRSVARLKEELQSILQTTLYGFVGHKYKLITETIFNKYIKKEFYHTWRTDGKRFLLFILGENKIYLIDEVNKYYKIDNLKFRHPHKDGKHLTATILDGELVTDVISSKKYYQYMISDIYALDGNRINQASFTSRLSMIQEFIMDIRKKADNAESEKEPFNIIMKRMSERKKLLKTWTTLRKTLTHKMTGLIFYPYRDVSYTFLGRATIYIWIPAFYRYIKFKLKAVMDKNASQWEGLLFVYGDTTPYSKVIPLSEEEKERYDGKIVRCFLNKNNHWKISNYDPDDKVPISKWDISEEKSDWKHPISFKELL